MSRRANGTDTRGRACDGKIAHPNRGAALRAIAVMVARGTAPGTLIPYRCRWCDSWHTGHRPGTSRRRTP